MLKNRADDEMIVSFEERNTKDRIFFSTGSYRDLPSHMTGVDALRGRLWKLLYNHLKKELPGLWGELDSMIVSTIKELELMGQTRASTQDQRLFLMKICVDAHAIKDAAVRGTYDSPFFGYVDVKAAVDDIENSRRLRAVVQ